MQSPDHVERIKEGVAVWNKWREKNPDIRPSLGLADLSGLDLSGAELSDADLAGSQLNRCNLSRADLTDADLRGTDLRWVVLDTAHLHGAQLCAAALQWANLNTAQLSGADLEGAVLYEADLTFASLTRANLRGANLTGANLKGVICAYTLFIDTDLTQARGLDSCQHVGPSTLDHLTLNKSGPLPLTFLRGCGLPDLFIKNSLMNDNPGYHSCFISYSVSDQEFADQLYTDLQRSGVRCWFAQHDMQRGKKIHEQIDEAINRHEKLLLILSQESMASNWVKTEIATARRREHVEGIRMLFPVSIVPYEHLRSWKCFDADTGLDSAREIREYLVADFSNWKEPASYWSAFQALLRDLKANEAAAATSG